MIITVREIFQLTEAVGLVLMELDKARKAAGLGQAEKASALVAAEARLEDFVEKKLLNAELLIRSRGSLSSRILLTCSILSS